MNDAKDPSTPPGAVKLQKRTAGPRSLLREKTCATCGRSFTLEPEQKFFDCPACYQRKQKSKTRDKSRILVQIQCIQCGRTEFLDVQPPDPQAALCSACFAEKRRDAKDLPQSHDPRR